MTARAPRARKPRVGFSQNSLRHGLRTTAIIVPGESQEEWLGFREEIIAGYEPVGPIEEALAHRAAEALWRLRRVSRAEALNVIDRAAGREGVIQFRKDVQAAPDHSAYVKAFFDPDRVPAFLPIPRDEQLDSFIRYEAHLSRQFYQAHHELEARRDRREGRAAPLARLEINAPDAGTLPVLSAENMKTAEP